MQVFSTRGIEFSGGLPHVTGGRTIGPRELLTTNERHITPASREVDPAQSGVGFAEALNQALGNVEKLDQTSQELTQKSVFDPDSVEAHTLLIAAERARFALNLTKTMADGLVRTFKELTNPR